MALAIIATLAAWVALATGGLETTARTIPGLVPNPVPHTWWATGAAVAILILIAIAATKPRARKLAGALILALVAQGGLRGGFVHALLGQAIVAGLAALCVVLSDSWSREPQRVQDYGWPSLRSLAFLLPVLVMVQIALGAGFRHQMLSLIPHLAGAMLIAMFILTVGAFVLQQCKEHKTLLGWGRVLIGLTCVQLFLGIAAYTVRAVPKTSAHVVLAMVTAHVTAAALVLASSVVLGMHIRRNVIPKAK